MIDSLYMKIGNHATNMLADYVRRLVNNAERVKFKDLIGEKFPESKKGEIKALAFRSCKEETNIFSGGRIKKFSLDIDYDPYILKRTDNIIPINTLKSNPEVNEYISLKSSRETLIRLKYILEKAPLQFFKKEGLSEAWIHLNTWPERNLKEIISSDVIILNEEKIEELENILKNNKTYLRFARDEGW